MTLSLYRFCIPWCSVTGDRATPGLVCGTYRICLYIWAFLVGTLTLLGYGQTNLSMVWLHVITAQPEVCVWLDALYLSGFLCEERIQIFFSNGYWSIIVLIILSFVCLTVGRHWDEEVLLLSWHLDPSGTSRWWVAYDIHMAQLFLKHTKTHSNSVPSYLDVYGQHRQPSYGVCIISVIE